MQNRQGALCAAFVAGLLICAPVHGQTSPGWRTQLDAFAHAHFRHPAWGWQHSKRDYLVARDLARADHVAVDDDVLFAAAYVHDIAGFAPWEDKDLHHDHSDVGAAKLGPVLISLGFPAAKIDAVREATRTHMFYRKAVTPEAIYIHDADALDWLGAIGVARILATTEHANPPPAADAAPDPYSAPDLAAAVAEIERNLREAPAGIQSPAGRARIPGLVAEARRFLSELKAETDNGAAL